MWTRVATAGIVAALVAVGIAAVVDAARSEGEDDRTSAEPSRTDPSPQPAPRTDREELAAALEAEGIAGVLYYSDPDDECRLAATALPSLTAVPPPVLRACRFELPPSAEASATLSGVTWRPDGLAAARCRRGHVEVLAPDGGPIEDFEGCAPAWKPNGRLTFVRAGEIVEARVPCVRAAVCERIVFSKRELRRAFLGDPSFRWLYRTASARWKFRDVAWFTNTRSAASIQLVTEHRLPDVVQQRQRLPVVFEQKQPLDPLVSYGFGRLELGPMSPRRTEILLDADGSPVPWRLRRDGGLSFEWLPPSLSNVSAVTWSPDERWQAVATRASIYVFERNQEQPRLIRLPIAAADVSWR